MSKLHTRRQTEQFIAEQKQKVYKHRYSNTSIRECQEHLPLNNGAMKIILLIYEHDRIILELENEEVSKDRTDAQIKHLKIIRERLNAIGLFAD